MSEVTWLRDFDKQQGFEQRDNTDNVTLTVTSHEAALLNRLRNGNRITPEFLETYFRPSHVILDSLKRCFQTSDESRAAVYLVLYLRTDKDSWESLVTEDVLESGKKWEGVSKGITQLRVKGYLEERIPPWRMYTVTQKFISQLFKERDI